MKRVLIFCVVGFKLGGNERAAVAVGDRVESGVGITITVQAADGASTRVTLPTLRVRPVSSKIVSSIAVLFVSADSYTFSSVSSGVQASVG